MIGGTKVNNQPQLTPVEAYPLLHPARKYGRVNILGT